MQSEKRERKKGVGLRSLTLTSWSRYGPKRFWGRHLIRKWERRAALSGEYGLKAIYGWLIGLGTHASYGNEDLTIHAWIENAPDDVFADGTVKRKKDLGHHASIVTIPRYEAFTVRALLLLAQGVRFVDIAGNDHIVLTVLTPTSAASDDVGGEVIFREPLLTDPETTRVAINVPVRSLHAVVEALQRSGSKVEHLYDY